MRRRHFLQASASLGLLQYSGLQAKTKTNKLGVALVGLGRYSEYQLAPALSMTDHCELRGIVTGSPKKIPVWQERYSIPDSNIYSYENLHEAVNNDDIDVIYVVVPTSLHKKFTLIAANAGKHVWCEKPMAMTVEDCQIMIDACEKNKVQLTVGYRVHHEPNTQTIMRYAQTMPYGSLETVIAKAGYKGGAPAKGNWRLERSMGGGAAYDMGVYPINGARNMVGAEPVAVSAQHKVYRPDVFTNTDEATFFQLEFKNGLIAECATSVFESMNLLRANAREGWYELSPFQSYNGVKGRTSDGKQLNQRIDNQQAAQMDNDALSIINNTAPKVPGLEGLHDIRVVEAILESARLNGERIEL